MNKFKYFPVVFLGFVVLVLPVCGWVPPVKVSTHPDSVGNDDSFPDIAVDSLGNSYITWSCRAGINVEIHWVKVDATGVPGTVQKISTHPDNLDITDVYKPNIGIDNAGNSYITWRCWDGNYREVYWVKIDATGVPGAVQMVSKPLDNIHGYNSDSEIAVDSLGNSYITWQGWDGTKSPIHWVKVDASGVPGTVQEISTHPDNMIRGGGRPQIGADSSGNSYVVYSGEDGWDKEVYWVKIDATGVPGTVQKISTHPDNIDGNDWDPQIAVDSSGNSYVVWWGCDGEDCPFGLGDLEIYWVKIDATGVPGTVQKISTHPDNENNTDRYSHIAVDASENSYVVWQGDDGSCWGTYWVKVDATGVPGTVQKISTGYSPHIAVDTSENSYVIWTSSGDIWWVKVDATGVPGAVENITKGLYGGSPKIALDPLGNSYVVWENYGGGDSEIYYTSSHSIPITFGSLAELFHDNTFLIAGDNAYSTDVLGSAKISHALGQAGTVNPEGRTEVILTPLEHDTGNLIPVGGPAVSPIADEFNGYFGITFNYDPDVNRVFEIFWSTYSITLDLDNYPGEDICIVYLDEHNGRNVMLVWGYGWQGTYAGSVFIGDLNNWSLYTDAHMAMIRWIDLNADGLVQSNEITVEQYA